MKNLILELFEDSGQLDPQTILARLAVATVIAGFIFLSYRISHEGSIYSKKFNVSLVALTIITTSVMVVIGNNIALSLGMVGALSIVRFRTAIKEPMDIAFLFWSIAVGIVLAAGLLFLAVLGSAFVGLVLWWFARRRGGESPYILVLHCADAQTEDAAKALVDSAVKKWNLKSKSVTPGQIELNYEVRLRAGDAAFVNTLGELDGVTNVVLVSYNGDYMG